MDDNHFFNLLKNLQSVMKCPSCESVYEVSEMQFVGSQDGYFLLSMTCTKCSLPVWVNVFAGNNKGGKLLAGDLTVNDLRLLSRDPISSAEVIDFHLGLKNFNGDFKKVFK